MSQSLNQKPCKAVSEGFGNHAGTTSAAGSGVRECEKGGRGDIADCTVNW